MKTGWVRDSVRKLAAYTPGEQPERGRFVKLNTNENPYPPSPKVTAALADLDAARLRLYPDPVSLALRRRIADLHRCRVDQVFVGNGSDEVLSLCTTAFVEDGEKIGYLDPSYSLYPVLADIRAVRKRSVPLNRDFGWPFNGDAPTAAIRGCSLFFITNPNAPTGIQYPKERIRAFCRAFPGVVVLDEAYVDFARENCMDLALRMPNVLVVRTFSKAHSLAGLRVGYTVGSATLIRALFKIKDSYNLDAISQRLALAALSDVAHMRRNVRRIRTTRERLAKVLAAWGYEVLPSESNFLWTKPDGIRAPDLFRALRKRGVLIRYWPGRRTGAFVRITIGTDAEVNALLRAIREIQDERRGVVRE